MSHRDVLATCLGVLLPPARALAVLGAGACPSNWRLELGRKTVQAGHWAVLPPCTGWPSGAHPATPSSRAAVGPADRARGLTGIRQNDWEFDW